MHGGLSGLNPQHGISRDWHSYGDSRAEEVQREGQAHFLIPTKFKASLGSVRPAPKIVKNNYSFMAILRYY